MKYITMFGLIATLLVSCGKKDDGIAKKAGEVIGQQVTDFTKGVGKGIDQKMMVVVSLSPQVQALGLTNTVAKSLGMLPNKSPEPTAVGACSSAVAVHVANRRWLSFFR